MLQLLSCFYKDCFSECYFYEAVILNLIFKKSNCFNIIYSVVGISKCTKFLSYSKKYSNFIVICLRMLFFIKNVTLYLKTKL